MPALDAGVSTCSRFKTVVRAHTGDMGLRPVHRISQGDLARAVGGPTEGAILVYWVVSDASLLNRGSGASLVQSKDVLQGSSAASAAEESDNSHLVFVYS